MAPKKFICRQSRFRKPVWYRIQLLARAVPLMILGATIVTIAIASSALSTAVAIPNDFVFNASSFLTDLSVPSGRELLLNGKISGLAPWKKDDLAAGGAQILANTANDFTGTIIAAANNALGDVTSTLVISNSTSLAFRGGVNYSARKPVIIQGMGRNGNGALSNDSGNCSFAGPITMAGNSGIGGAAGTTLTLHGIISDIGPPQVLSKLTAGTVRLTAANSYSGGTLISNGTLIVANTTGSATGPGPLTIFSGGTLAGSGSVAGAVIVNGTVAPGSSPGTLNTGSETWNSGGSYVWEINDALATAGADPGWDLLNINGSLTIGATSADKFTVNITSLTIADLAGNASNFDNTQDYTWTIATASAGVTGFDATAFNLVATNFSNPLGNGLFVIEQSGNNILLRFARTPAIVAGPIAQTAECTTGSAMFTVSATGTAPLSYQWRFNSNNLSATTGPTLALNNVSPAQAGYYDCVVSNPYGSSTSAPATLTVADTVPPSITCPANVTVQCDAEVPAPNFAGGSVSDACDLAPTVTHQGDVTNGACPKTITRTYKATDASGNAATCTQIITVNDTTPPTIDCGTNQTVEAGLAWNFSLPIVSDNCGAGGLTLLIISTDTNTACGRTFAATRVWKAVDICGNSTLCTQVVTVVDTTGPSLTCPANLTVQCDGEVPAPEVSSVAVSDSGDPNPVVTHGGDVTNGVGPKIITRTYKATDACGNISTCTQTITVRDTTPPTISCGTNQTIEAGRPWDFTVPIVTDNCGAAGVTLQMVSTSTNAACGKTFVATRIWQGTDGCGNSTLCTQVVTVVDTTPPTINCPAAVDVICDADLPPPNIASVTVSDNGDPNPTVTHAGDVTNSTSLKTITRTYEATDACGNMANCTQTITINDTQPPTITTCAPDRTVCADVGGQALVPDFTAAVVATDNCNGITITQSPVAGTLVGVGTTNVTLTVRDSATNSATCIATLTVNAATTATRPSSASNVLPGSSIMFSTTATGTGPFSYQWMKSGTNISGANGSSLTINSVGSNDAGTYCVIVTGACNTVTNCATLTVASGPTITTQPQSQTIECSSNATFIVSATGTAPLAYQWYQDSRALADQTNNPLTLLNLHSSAAGIYTVVISDIVNSVTSAPAALTVIDTIPPVITECASNQTLNAGANCTALLPDLRAGVMADDACGIASITQNPAAGTPLGSGLHQINIIATDLGGNTTSCVVTVTVLDAAPPIVVCPTNTVVECANPAGTAVNFTVTATANCGGPPTISCAPPSGSVFQFGTTTVSCQATDPNGNSNTCSFTVSVVDRTAPVVCVDSGPGIYHGDIDDFVGSEPASPRPELLQYLAGVDFKGLDDGCFDTFFADSFAGLPANIVGATLRIKLRACDGFPQNDTLSLLFTLPGGMLRPEQWNRRLGSLDADPGLLGALWTDATREFVLDLSRLPNVASPATDLVPTLSQLRYLDLYVQDDTIVDYVKLELKTCDCQAGLSVAVTPGRCDAVINYALPQFTDNCDTNLIVICTPPPGATFPMGQTTVACTARDHSGNSNTCSFTITVGQPLTIQRQGNTVTICWPTNTCASYTLEATSGLEGQIVWTAVNAAPTVIDERYCVTLAIQPNRRFFRLTSN